MNTRAAAFICCLSLVRLLTSSWPAAAQVVDHHAIPQVETLPQATIEQISRLRWYFIHASVGDNIMQGLRDLNRANAARYPLAVSTLASNPVPPVPTVPGAVYENHFSSGKMVEFQSMVNTNGWHGPAVDVALMKFCYLDGLATALTPGPQLATQYVTMIASLEQRYTGTVFVYVSMPLLIYREEGDPRRDPNYLASIVNINRFNDALRAQCRAGNRLLYDLAAMESHDPAGNEATFTWTNGLSYPVIYAPYVYDTNNPPGANSGHLIAPGRQQVAKGWYALAAAIAGSRTAMPQLDWSLDARSLQFSWEGSGFILQRNSNLAHALDWQDVPGANSGSYAVTNDNTPTAFFRLRRQ